MTGYLERDLASRIDALLASMPVVVLSGARQSGKTTFLQHDRSLESRRFLSLDDPALLEGARREPDRLLEGAEAITIDEAQKCPELFPALKRAVDRRRRNGQFLLSGSASFPLLRSVSESLAGRAIHVALEPFSQRELERKTTRPPFLVEWIQRGVAPDSERSQPVGEERVFAGGFPSVALGKVRGRSIWFAGYEQTYLERDLRDLAQIADLGAFRRVLGLAALRSGQLVNEAEIARDAKVSSPTAGKYLDLLEIACVAMRLPPFLASRAARLVKSPKFYLCDSGLAAHLIGLDELTPRGGERFRGVLFETWVAQNLRSILGCHLPAAKLAFFNVQGRYEVDFVITHQRSHFAVEVKSSSSFDDGDLKGLRRFADSTRGVEALVLAYNGRESVHIDERTWAIPISKLLG
jgi:predicted AAA+ superfamily ATPase